MSCHVREATRTKHLTGAPKSNEVSFKRYLVSCTSKLCEFHNAIPMNYYGINDATPSFLD